MVENDGVEWKVKVAHCENVQTFQFAERWKRRISAELCEPLHSFDDENGKSFDLMEMTIDTMALTKHKKGSVH